MAQRTDVQIVERRGVFAHPELAERVNAALDELQRAVVALVEAEDAGGLVATQEAVSCAAQACSCGWWIVQARATGDAGVEKSQREAYRSMLDSAKIRLPDAPAS